MASIYDTELAKRVSVPTLPPSGNFSVNKFLKTRGVGLTVEEVSSVYPNKIRTVGSDNCDFNNVQDAIDDIRSYVSVVDVNNTIVTWKSGDKFTDVDYFAPGMRLYINMYNVTPTIDKLSEIVSVDSDTQLTIKTSLGTLTDVSCGAGPGQFNRYCVLVYPDTYIQESPLILRDGVDIVGLVSRTCIVRFSLSCTEMFNYDNTFDKTFGSIAGAFYFYNMYFSFSNTAVSGIVFTVFKNTTAVATGFIPSLSFYNSIVTAACYGPYATYDSECIVVSPGPEIVMGTHLAFNDQSSLLISTGWIDPNAEKVLIKTSGQFRIQTRSTFSVGIFGKNIAADLTVVDIASYNDVFISDSTISFPLYHTRVSGKDILFRATGAEANIVLTNDLVNLSQAEPSISEMYFMYWRSPSQMDSDSYNTLNYVRFIIGENFLAKKKVLLSDNRFSITEIIGCDYPGMLLEGDGRRYISYDFADSAQAEPTFNSGAYQGNSVLYARGNHRHGVPRLPFTFASKAPTNPRQGDIWIETNLT